MQMTEEILEFIVTNLVDNPEDIQIEARDDEDGTVQLELRVNPEDMGKVIGKRGRTAKAIRTMVKAAGTREGVNASVEIVE